MASKKKCAQCAHTWDARIPNPAQCPRCKSYRWASKKGKRNATK